MSLLLHKYIWLSEQDLLKLAITETITNPPPISNDHPALKEYDVSEMASKLHPLDYEVDHEGNTAAMLAIKVNNAVALKQLLQAGASTLMFDKKGWSVLDEAVISGQYPLAATAYLYSKNEMSEVYNKKLPKMLDALENQEDFYMELDWKFKSWVPFVSRLCPSDTYKIHCRGSSLRIDTTLVDYDNRTWIRGNVSYYLIGRNCGPLSNRVIIVDHDEKIYIDLTEQMIEVGEISAEEFQDQIMVLMSHEAVDASISTEQMVFQEARGWFSGVRQEEISGYPTTVYSVKNCGMTTHVRYGPRTHVDQKVQKKILKNCPDFPNHLTKSFEEHFNEENEINDSGNVEHNTYPNPYVETMEKSATPEVWVSTEYPLSISDVLPIIEVMAPTNKHFSHLRTFLLCSFPNEGFPVKINIPVAPTVHGEATFSVFERQQVDENLFHIPENYTKIKDMDYRQKMKEDKENAESEGL